MSDSVITYIRGYVRGWPSLYIAGDGRGTELRKNAGERPIAPTAPTARRLDIFPFPFPFDRPSRRRLPLICVVLRYGLFLTGSLCTVSKRDLFQKVWNKK